jgi:hypothetical protein
MHIPPAFPGDASEDETSPANGGATLTPDMEDVFALWVKQ